ncbi:MAG: peptidylprolyl isomerase [Cyanobacteria bacterium P01_A01_bin.45]
MLKKLEEIGNQSIDIKELIPILGSYGMIPHLLRERIISKAIANVSCNEEEIHIALKQFFQQHGVTNKDEHQALLEGYGMTQTQLNAMVTRSYRIEKFKEQQWGNKLKSYFLKRKQSLDRVIYSMLRTQSEIAHELYFRIQEGEQSFGELAHEYSQGAEADSYGIVGPVDLGDLHPGLARQLAVSQPGKVWHPVKLDEYLVIMRLEKYIPAQLDRFMGQRLLNELFETWLREQIHNLPAADKAWLVPRSKVTSIDTKNAVNAA